MRSGGDAAFKCLRRKGTVCWLAACAPDQEIGERIEGRVAAFDSLKYDVPIDVLDIEAGADRVFPVRPGDRIGDLELIGRVEHVVANAAADIKQPLNGNGVHRVNGRVDGSHTQLGRRERHAVVSRSEVALKRQSGFVHNTIGHERGEL